MSARDRAERVLTEVDLDALEAAGLRVIDEPEPPYDVIDAGPVWIGDDWTVVAKPDGEIEVVVADDAHPGNGGATYVFEPEVAAAISAAHIRGSEYR